MPYESDGVRRITSHLDGLDWTGNWVDAHTAVEELLRREWEARGRLFADLQAHLRAQGMPVINRTAELHSWMLHQTDDYCLKLHEFRPSPLSGYSSEGIHNHTRPLTSLTLCGGYSQDWFHPDVDAFRYGDAFRLSDLPRSIGRTTFGGDVYTIGPEAFHAVNGFMDGTLTLVVFGKIVRDAITVFNKVSGRVERRVTCNQAKQEMLAHLRGLEMSDG